MELVVAAIVTQLEEDIVLGYVHLRERLVEDALMERFAAKRYAVREALAQLARLGLVERLPNIELPDKAKPEWKRSFTLRGGGAAAFHRSAEHAV